MRLYRTNGIKQKRKVKPITIITETLFNWLRSQLMFTYDITIAAPFQLYTVGGRQV
jgi:hypothetical protein